MTKVIRVIGIIVAMSIVVSQPQVLNAVFALLFAGVVPFTHIVLPFWAMSLLLATIAYAALRWLRRQPLFIGDTAHRERLAKSRARSHVLSVAAAQNQKHTAKKSAVRRTRKRYQTATS